MKKKQYKAVFRTRIELQYDELRKKSLFSDESYYPDKYYEEKVLYNDISNEAIRIINSDLKPELQKFTDILIDEVQVQAVYEGSIEIIYTVILGFFNLVSGLKDLYDAVLLIREISERYINKNLSDKFGKYFDVDTYVIVPKSIDYLRSEENMRQNRMVDIGVEKRDAFFYYLLVFNIVLLVIVGALVLGAVKAVYFGG